MKATLSLSPSGLGRVGSNGGSPTSKMGYCGGVPVEDMQALAITALSAADVAKQYEHIRELGKGTYGKVDLVAHRTQGELIGASGDQPLANALHPFICASAREFIATN